MNEDVIPLVVLPLMVIGVTTIIILPWLLRTKERFKAHDTLRYLIDKGQSPPAELLAGLIEQPKPRRPGEHDLRASIFWLSVAIGICTLGSSIAWVSDPGGNGWIIAPGVGAFPASIGLGYLLLWWLNRSKQQI
jgi:hypothetical protein